MCRIFLKFKLPNAYMGEFSCWGRIEANRVPGNMKREMNRNMAENDTLARGRKLVMERA